MSSSALVPVYHGVGWLCASISSIDHAHHICVW